jgi:hypothetical protein
VSTFVVDVVTEKGPLVTVLLAGYSLKSSSTLTVPVKFLKSGMKRLIDISLSPASGMTNSPDFISELSAAPSALFPFSCACMKLLPSVSPVMVLIVALESVALYDVA